MSSRNLTLITAPTKPSYAPWRTDCAHTGSRCIYRASGVCSGCGRHRMPASAVTEMVRPLATAQQRLAIQL